MKKSGKNGELGSKGFKKGTTGTPKEQQQRGSITYVPMSDILSGKVQLPNANKPADTS